jgi:DNA-binding transcriptional LysR family regulator
MPGVSVTVASGDMLRLLRNRDVDLAVVTNPETDPSVEVLAAHDVPLVAWCHRDHPLHGGRPGIWDLVEGRLVLPPEGTGSRSAISHVLRRHNLKEGVTSSVPAAQLAQAMGGGMRTCIFPGCVLDEETLADRLHPLPLEIGNVQISVLRLSGVPLSRPAQSFLRHMERRLNLEAF